MTTISFLIKESLPYIKKEDVTNKILISFVYFLLNKRIKFIICTCINLTFIFMYHASYT